MSGYEYADKKLWYDEQGQPVYGNGIEGTADDTGWSLEAFIDSPLGEWQLAQARAKAPGRQDEMAAQVLEHWARLGLKKELYHADGTDGVHYAVFTPVQREPGRSYPVVFVNHGGGDEPYDAEWYGFLEEAAQRGYMAVCLSWKSQYFAEQAEEQGYTVEAYCFKMVYEELLQRGYPMDRSRVYVVGISGGGNAAGFMGSGCAPLIAAISPATGAAIQGSGVAGGSVGADPLEKIRACGMGMMMGYGLCDAEHRWPISEKLKEMGKSLHRTPEQRLETLNQWIAACGAATPETTMEQLQGYLASEEKRASTLFGMNFDREYTKQMNGFTYYFGEDYTREGKLIVRFMGVPMTGHFYSKGWAAEVMDFFAKFRRDEQTHELICLD